MVEAQSLTKLFTEKKREKKSFLISRSRSGEVRAVSNLSFSCAPGQVFGILGPNGAGKTTILRMISTVLKPTSGSAFVDGHDVEKEPNQVRRKIGFLSGDTGVYPRLTAQEMIAYFGMLHGLGGSKLDKRVEDILSFLEMKDFAHRRCDKLSQGMKQKVSIARSVVHDPPVMVFDEPTVGLDVMTSRTIVDFIRRCRDDGKTVLFSTHVMVEAEKLCDQVLVLYKGEALETGTTQKILESTGAPDLEEAFLSLVEGRA